MGLKKKIELGADIDISKLLSGLQKAKTQAKDFDEIMSNIGNYANLKKLAENFKGLSAVIEEMQDSVDAMQAKLGENIKGGFISGLDNAFGKMAQISDIAKQVFTGLSNVKLKDKGASAELVKYAGQLNMLFKNLGIDQQVDIELLNTMNVKEQFDEIIKYAGAFGKELKITLGSIDTSAFESIGNDMASNINQSGQKITDAMQKQIDAVEKKIDTYKGTLKELQLALKNAQKFNDADAIDPGINGVKDQDKYVKDAIDNYNKYHDATKDLRDGTRTPVTIEDYELLIKYTNALLKITALQDARGSLNIKGDLSTFLRDALDKDVDYGDWIESFETKFKASISRALNGAIASSKAEISKIKRGEMSSQEKKSQTPVKTASAYDDNGIIEDKAQQYKELIVILQEYASVLKAVGDAEDASVIAVSDKLENVLNRMSFSKDKKENDKIAFAMRDALGDIEYGDLLEEDISSRLAEILGIEIPKAAEKAETAAGSSIQQIGQYAMDATEYINNMAIALRNLFDAASKKSDIEYKILINGHEIDARAGGAGEVSLKTAMEAYLSNLGGDTIVDAHSHQGKAANIDLPDFKSAIAKQYGGVAKLSAIIGDKDIVTLDLAKVKAEDAYQAIEKVEAAIAKAGTGVVTPDKLNSIFKEINPEYDNVAQKWDPSQFKDLASYILDVKTSTEQALDPLTRFKNLLMFAADGKIDLSKYENLFKNFSVDNAGNIFNQIMQAEGIKEDGQILQVSNLQKGSIDNIIKDIQRQKDAYIQMRDEANITYSDIHNYVQRYLDDVRSGGEGKDVYNQLKPFFNQDELVEISTIFRQLEDGMIGANQAANQLAGYFNQISPDDYAPIATITKEAVEATQKENEELKEKNRLLEEEAAKKQGSSKVMAEGNEVSLTEKVNACIQETNALLDKQKLTYEDILALVKIYNNEDLITAAYRAGDSLATDRLDENKKNIRDKLLFNNIPLSDDFNDTYNWLNMIELSAEEAAQNIYKLYSSISAVDSGKLISELDQLWDKASDTSDLGELHQIVRQRRAILDILKETGVFSNQFLQNENDLTATLERQIVAERNRINLFEDDDTEVIQRENGALQDKLTVLRDIADTYGMQITQKDRNRYAELEDKNNASGLTSKEEEKFDELDAKISEADESLCDFGETYDRIILKLSNGKKVEILPNDTGLRQLDKIANEYYDGEYNGFEIEDVQFERAQVFLKEKIESYEELCKVVERYNQLVKIPAEKMTNAEKRELDAIRARFDVTEVTNSHLDPDFWKTQGKNPYSFDGTTDAEKVAQYLGIKIPQAADKAEEAVKEVEQAVSDIVYHAGDLSNIANTLKSFPLGNVAPYKASSNTFASLTGLYTTEDVGEFRGNEWDGAPISSIDLSHYKMFDARSDELATKVNNFFSDLNGTIYGYINAIDENTFEEIKTTDVKTVEQLYAEFKEVFKGIELDFKEFADFIEKSKAIIKGYDFTGVESIDISEQIGKSAVGHALQGGSDDVFNSDNFGTQLVKMLGFEGMDLRGTKFNGTYTGGTIIFDIKPESLKDVNEKWSDVMARNGYEVTEDDLAREEKRRQLAFETAKANSIIADEIHEQNNAIEESVQEQKQLNQERAEIKYFETESEQQTVFDGMSDGLQRAENKAEEVKDTIKEIAVLDGQISSDELNDAAQKYDKICKILDEYEAKSKSIRKMGSGGRPTDDYAHLVGDALSDIQKVIPGIDAAQIPLLQGSQAVLDFVAQHLGIVREINAENAEGVKIAQEELVIENQTTNELDEQLQLEKQISDESKKESGAISSNPVAATNDIPLAENRDELERIISNKFGTGISEHMIVNAETDMTSGITKVAGAYKDANGELKTYNLTIDKNQKITKESIGYNKTLANSYETLKKKQKEANDAVKKEVKKEPKKTEQEKEIEEAIRREKQRKHTAVRTAEERYNQITGRVQETQLIGDASAKFDQYVAKYKEFKKLLTDIDNKAVPDNEETRVKFDRLKKDVAKLARDMDSLEKRSEKAQKDAVQVDADILKGIDINNLDALKQKMEAFANSVQDGKVKNLQFDDSMKMLTYEVHKGNGVIEKMTISVDEYSSKLIKAKANSKGLTTAFGQFAKVMNQGMTNVYRYVSSFVGFYEVINQVRKGVTYIKEIDTALTDLKKVTDETEVSYDKFLDRMAKTAGVVGSTVTNLTTMAAEWARLGYSLKEAGDLAESTAILLNVSEFQDATQASEALISTIQAFGYAANESMSVVDILNEVGEYVALR